MKVGVLTFHQADNFGAVWQAYALCEAIKRAGHDPIVIDYRPLSIRQGYRMPKGRFFFTPRMLGRFRQRWRFEQFRRTRFTAVTRTYWTHEALREDPPVADAYICGSDQIWNPKMFEGAYDPAYFLDFVRAGRRISYAASFGEAGALHDPDNLERYLGGFDALSVREKAAVLMLQQTLDFAVELVPDPVFLLEEYTRFVPSDGNRPPRYLFTYNLHGFRRADDVSQTLAGKLGLKWWRIHTDWKVWKHPFHILYFPGPQQWIRIIHGASLVVTDSFHGTAFALLLKKNFLSVLSHPENKPTSRIYNLLTDLGLQDRIADAEDSSEQLEAKSHAPIDWEQVGDRLSKLRDRGNRYLDHVLNQAGIM